MAKNQMKLPNLENWSSGKLTESVKFEIQLFPGVEQKRSPLFSPSVKSVDEETLLFFSCIAKFSDIFDIYLICS